MILDILSKERPFLKEGNVTFEFFLFYQRNVIIPIFICTHLFLLSKKKSEFLFSVNGSRPNSCAVANFR